MNFANENPDVCKRAVVYWLTNSAYCMLLLEISDYQYYLRRYVCSTFIHALANIPFARTGITIVSAICSECNAPPPNIVISDLDSCRLFHFQNICALEQQQSRASSHSVHLFCEFHALTTLWLVIVTSVRLSSWHPSAWPSPPLLPHRVCDLTTCWRSARTHPCFHSYD